MDNRIKLLAGAAVIIFILYLLNSKYGSSMPTFNQGAVSANPAVFPGTTLSDQHSAGTSYMGQINQPQKTLQSPSVTDQDSEIMVNMRDFDSENMMPPQDSTYRAPDDWDAYFDEYNSVIGKSQIRLSNDKFVPYDESGTHARYDGRQKKSQPKRPRKVQNGGFDPEMYDPENVLPKEIHSDWFEVIDEPVGLKNRHLISLQQPLGINTVLQSLKVPNLDLRAAPACPKMDVGPWNLSTVEPDYNIKPLC